LAESIFELTHPLRSISITESSSLLRDEPPLRLASVLSFSGKNARLEFDRIKSEYPEITGVLKKMSSEKTEKISALVMKGVIL
jgi:hypothetical protein